MPKGRGKRGGGGCCFSRRLWAEERSQGSVKKSRSLPTDPLPARGAKRVRRGAAEPFPGPRHPPTGAWVCEFTHRLNICGPWVPIVIAGFPERERSVLPPSLPPPPPPLNRSSAPSSARLTLPAPVPAEEALSSFRRKFTWDFLAESKEGSLCDFFCISLRKS